MQTNTHLNFNGQCEEAFKFYERCLGAKIEMMMTWGESPMAKEVTPDMGKKIMHANLSMGVYNISGGDVAPKHYQKPQGFAVMLDIDTTADADRIFKTLEVGGMVVMPIQETFWAQRFGMVVDRFGTPWAINCGKTA
jgi:PhnB protein